MQEYVLNSFPSLLFLVLLSVLHRTPVLKSWLPLHCEWWNDSVLLMWLPGTWFLEAAAKIQTSKEHDMNRIFRKVIVIVSSNTSTFILFLEQLLNAHWSLLVTLVLSWLNLFVVASKIALTHIPPYNLIANILQGMSWHDKTNGKSECITLYRSDSFFLLSPYLFLPWLGTKWTGWLSVLVRELLFVIYGFILLK